VSESKIERDPESKRECERARGRESERVRE